MSETQEIRWKTKTETDSGSIIRIGAWSVGVLMVLFVVWGTTFPLSSAVITPGTVVSEGRNKLIQHSSGGQVLEIKVREGDFLEEGQIVLTLDPTQARADLSRLDARHASLSALKARLDAERSGGERLMPGPKPSFKEFKLRGVPSEPSAPLKLGLRNGEGGVVFLAETLKPLLPVTTPLIDPIVTASVPDELMDSQRAAYRSGQDLLTQEIAALEKKANTLRRQKSGLEARISAQMDLKRLSEKELERLKPLARQGYVARNRLEDKHRALVELTGNITALKLDGASYDNQIGEIDIQIEKARIARRDSAYKEYAKIVAEISEISDQRRAARAVVESMEVPAPVSGTLTKLSVTTNGGVFGGGDVIGEIVPEGTPVLVEARVSPADIDYVQVGQSADIVITAFNRRLDDTMKGEVTYVSADSETDQQTGETYFVVRLKLVHAGESVDKRGDVQVGMQSEVYIHTGERTFLTYLGKPLLDSFERAFRER